MFQLPPVDTLFTMSTAGLKLSKQRLDNNDSRAAQALPALTAAADDAVSRPAHSVTEKPANILPPGATVHDYVSWAPYFHPVPGNSSAPYVEQDGKIVDDQFSAPDLKYFRQLVIDVSALSTAYYLTGDKKYADKANDLLTVWFLRPETRMNPSLKYAQVVRNTPDRAPYGVIDVYNMPMIVDAIVLLHDAGAISETMYVSLEDWFKEYLAWLTTSPQGVYEGEHFTNNRRTWYYAQVIAIAAFVGNKDLARATAEKGKVPIDTQIAKTGDQPQETNRTKKWAYITYNLGALLRLAWAANNVGVDLFNYVNPEQGSIFRALVFVAGYASGDYKWPYAEDVSAYNPTQAQPALAMGAYVYRDHAVEKANQAVAPPSAVTPLAFAY